MSPGRGVAEDRCVRWEWHSAEMAVDPTMSIKPRFVPYCGWLWLNRGCQRRKIRCLEGKRPGQTGRIWSLSHCGEQEYWKRGRTLLQKRSSTWLLWSGQGDFSLESCYLIAHSNSNKTYALVKNSTAKKVLIFGSNFFWQRPYPAEIAVQTTCFIASWYLDVSLLFALIVLLVPR